MTTSPNMQRKQKKRKYSHPVTRPIKGALVAGTCAVHVNVLFPELQPKQRDFEVIWTQISPNDKHRRFFLKVLTNCICHSPCKRFEFVLFYVAFRECLALVKRSLTLAGVMKRKPKQQNIRAV